MVDSQGHDVGPAIALNEVLRRIGGFTFGLHLDPNKSGFYDDVQLVNLWHISLDCSGTRYISDSGTDLTRSSFNNGVKLYYAADPLQQVTVLSYEEVTIPKGGDLPTQVGYCTTIQPTTGSYGLIVTFDLSTLGLVPPFHLQF